MWPPRRNSIEANSWNHPERHNLHTTQWASARLRPINPPGRIVREPKEQPTSCIQTTAKDKHTRSGLERHLRLRHVWRTCNLIGTIEAPRSARFCARSSPPPQRLPAGRLWETHARAPAPARLTCLEWRGLSPTWHPTKLAAHIARCALRCGRAHRGRAGMLTRHSAHRNPPSRPVCGDEAVLMVQRRWTM